jgi:F0F1-type ATP synthase membrane subunit c/vacuolar-type H+-ATPase subunit K
LTLVAALTFAAAVRIAIPRRVSQARPPKLATRGFPMLLGVWSLVAGLRAGGAGIVAALLAGTALAAGIGAYRRRGPSRAPCEICPERATADVCAGFHPIARREAALRRLATRWLRAVGRASEPE